jgi:DNA recombination protein RmuC
MNAPSLVALVLLCGAVFGALGYLIARSRVETDHREWGANIKVAEERARQLGKQADELRSERDDLKERADRLERIQAEQSVERRGRDEQMGRLDAELRSARTAAEKQQQELIACKSQLTELQAQQQAVREQAAGVEAAHKELDRTREENNRLQSESFKAMATEMLATSEQKLVTAADGKLNATSAAVRERLERLDQYLRQLDSQRVSANADLKAQITRLTQDNAESREQTRALVEALRKPQVRGNWGEMHLRRAVELAGMQEHCDFDTQVQLDGDEGRLRPDMVVHLAGGKNVVVDAKVSLAAFLSATEAADDAERERCWAEHAKQLRKHVDALAGKEYFRKVAGSPEFVVMFLPGESLLQPALERSPELLEYAASKRVFIAGPTTLITMLRAIAFAWTQAALQDNLQQVYDLGRELYERLGHLGGHLNTLGTSLDRSVSAYNKAIGSLESRVLVTARKFQTLKIVEGPLASLKPAEQAVRPLGSPELMAAADEDRMVRALPTSGAEGETDIA